MTLPVTNRSPCAFVLLVLWLGIGCSGQIASTATNANTEADGSTTAATAANNTLPVAGGGGGGHGNKQCTAFADTQEVGTVCQGTFGAGINDCVAGALVCVPCLPGATRTTACACGTHRLDICADDHNWLMGTCSLCPPTNNCRSGAGCTPGTTETRRCDTCTGANCGNGTAVTCVGSKWLCDGSCTWQQTAACAAMSPVCTQDTTQSGACGWCGTQASTCDGCFWVPGPCTGQGVCPAGDVQTIPCGARDSAGSAACPAQNTTATATCTALCAWAPASGCTCQVGATRSTTVSCRSGQCGKATQSQVCVSVTAPVCGNLTTLPSTTWQNTAAAADTSMCSTSCGGSNAGGGCNVCAPGDTRSQACTATCSLPGTQNQACSSDGCGWVNTGSCVPQDSNRCIGGTSVTHEACAAGYCSRSADPTHHLTTCQNNCYPLDQPCERCN